MMYSKLKSNQLFILLVAFCLTGAAVSLSAHQLAAATDNTYTYQVINATDDARNIVGTIQGDTGAATHYMGAKDDQSYVHGVRFANVDIPSDAVITSARLYFYSAGDVGTAAPRIIFQGDLSANSPTFRLVSDTPEHRTVTKASVSYTPNLSIWQQQGFISNGIDVTSVVKEVIENTSWKRGNALSIIERSEAAPYAYVSYSTYDRASDRGAKLVIEVENSKISGFRNLYKKLQNAVQKYTLESTLRLTSMGKNAALMAWIYPGNPACNAMEELATQQSLAVIKPEYYAVDGAGNLQLLTVASAGCNGFTSQNLAALKAHADKIFVTVSGGEDGVKSFFAKSPQTRETAIRELVNFTVAQDVTGIEIDFEGYGGWSKETYQAYLRFLSDLTQTLHAANKQVMVDVPPIGNSLEQSYYELRYEDIAALPIDYIVVMAYDYQYDHGSGSAIAPNDWVIDIVKSAQDAISPERLVMGIPAYGYYGRVGSYDMTVTTSDEVKKAGRLNTVDRDVHSYELMARQNGEAYVFQDTESLNKKRRLIESLGVRYISVWALGGNAWFSE